jgi:hypothetical protein
MVESVPDERAGIGSNQPVEDVLASELWSLDAEVDVELLHPVEDTLGVSMAGLTLVSGSHTGFCGGEPVLAAIWIDLDHVLRQTTLGVVAQRREPSAERHTRAAI